MSAPVIPRKGSPSPAPSGGPVFRTASGNLVQAKPGQSVILNDVKREVDVCIVFDTTGSMSNKIDGLVVCMVDFIGELARLKLDWRFSVVPFGDLTVPSDKIIGDLPFTNIAKKAQEMVQTMPRFGGGGNNGESSLEAMQAAMAKPFRKGAVRVLLLLTDEPPLQSRQLTTDTIKSALRAQEFVCFVVSVAGQGYEPFATENAGKWYPIGSSFDRSGLLAFLKGLLKDIATVSKAVHDMGGGSVKKYIDEVKRLELGR